MTDVDAAPTREEGAADETIHETVLLTPTFGRWTRYVNGLDTPAPDALSAYDERGAGMADEGDTRVRG